MMCALQLYYPIAFCSSSSLTASEAVAIIMSEAVAVDDASAARGACAGVRKVLIALGYAIL